MDYLQTLEFRMASLQRKIRLLQDLRFFVETSSPEELAAFGDELRSVATSSGTTVGSVLAGLLGASAGQALPATEAPPSAEPRPIGEGGQGSATRRPALPEAALPEASAPSLSPSAATEPLPVVESVDVRALFEASMKAISAGSFLMGSEANDSEKPVRRVALSGFRVCDHLVTNKEYSLFVAANPKWSKDRADPELRDESYLSDWSDGACPEGKEDNPVAFVSFHAAAAFAAWAGKRLLTEAEWECAARGGLVGKKYPNGDQMNDKIANLAKQYRGTTAVKKFEPNGFGLYDMAGNLFEWTSDWFGPYPPGEAKDPSGPISGDYKVARGGSWMSGAGALRVSARVDMEPQTCGQVGIRLADGG